MILAAIFLALYARHHAALNGAVRLLIAFILGVVVAAVQFTRHDTPQIGRGITGQIEGSLVKIDGRADPRWRDKYIGLYCRHNCRITFCWMAGCTAGIYRISCDG